jgi:hypothetical protein
MFIFIWTSKLKFCSTSPDLLVRPDQCTRLCLWLFVCASKRVHILSYSLWISSMVGGCSQFQCMPLISQHYQTFTVKSYRETLVTHSARNSHWKCVRNDYHQFVERNFVGTTVFKQILWVYFTCYNRTNLILVKKQFVSRAQNYQRDRIVTIQVGNRL